MILKKSPLAKIKIIRNWPYLVEGKLPLAKEIIKTDYTGVPLEWAEGGEKYPRQESYALCRCGQTSNPPFCDGAHIRAEFNDGDKSIK